MKRPYPVVTEGVRLEVLRHFVNGGGLAGLDQRREGVRSAIWRLKVAGLIDFVATDAGKAALIEWDAEEPLREEKRNRAKSRKLACEFASESLIRPVRPLECDKHPLATTDAQIEAIKRQAEQDRGFVLGDETEVTTTP